VHYVTVSATHRTTKVHSASVPYVKKGWHVVPGAWRQVRVSLCGTLSPHWIQASARWRAQTVCNSETTSVCVMGNMCTMLAYLRYVDKCTPAKHDRLRCVCNIAHARHVDEYRASGMYGDRLPCQSNRACTLMHRASGTEIGCIVY
jgi:hypothetical protein